MTKKLEFGPRRGIYLDIAEEMKGTPPLSKAEHEAFESFDLIYRSLCAILYNYVPMSGHPGGSISSGHFAQALLFESMDYDLSDPLREDADIISYAAGHKALGLYALWALRNEIARIGAPSLLAKEIKHQFRLEDLLGFRRNPITKTPLFTKFSSKALDGHPTPATPFVRLSTGASGVGLASSLGLAWGEVDRYGARPPKLHIVEGEGGMTPGRVAEALAAAGTAGLENAFMHVDWNQASIDSERVCRDGEEPGDYVQWNPMELAYLHDWNVIYVDDGMDFMKVVAAQRKALSLLNGQPTAVVYRTTKGWKYGIEGKASHGAGHKLCTPQFLESVQPLLSTTGGNLPTCHDGQQKCCAGQDEPMIEACFYEALTEIRMTLEGSEATVKEMARRLVDAKSRLDRLERTPRSKAPRIEAVYAAAVEAKTIVPEEYHLKAGATTTLRNELGRVLNYYNQKSGGCFLTAAADLMGSTSVNVVGKGFPEGFFQMKKNPESRNLSIGGICEDAMAGILSGLSTYGHNIGVGSSYGAFMAPLGHIAARLHSIGCQARQAVTGERYKPFVMVCAHAGLKTGEDGPTHADPQALQLLQDNFPSGTMVTLTPWDPNEIWTLMAESLSMRPAVIAPFVTRPNETIVDREKMGLSPASACATGMYLLRKAKGSGDGTVVLQESGVAYAFVEQALPLLEKEGMDLNVYYVASSELFDRLSTAEQERIFPEERAKEAMGITGFTLATMYRWIRSEWGQAMTLHPFRKGHFLGSGQGHKVLAEAGLDGESQFKAIIAYVKARKSGSRSALQR